MTTDSVANAHGGSRGARAARHQRHPRAGDGRRPEGQLRPPRHADGARAARARAVHAHHEVRRERAGLAGPRPLRALGRPRVDAPVLHALPHAGSASSSTTSSSSASGARARPGTPRRATPPGSRSPPARSGQGFANGVGMAIAERHLREHVRRRRLRPPRVRDLLRRRPRGGREPRGRVARRAPRARAPGLRLRRQPHLDRRPDRARLLRPTCRSRFQGYGWHVVELGEVAEDLDALEQGLREAMADEDRPSLVIAAQPHRLPVAQVHRHRRTRTASPLGDDEVAKVKEILGMPPEQFWSPDDVLALYRGAGTRGGAARAEWEAPSRQVPVGRRGPRRGLRPVPRRRGARRLAVTLPTWKAGEKLATRAACADRRRPAGRRVPGPARRRRRPHRQHRHRAQGPRRRSRATTSPAASSTSASASTAWAPP